MVKSEIISKLSERIHPKLSRKDLKKILQIFIKTIIIGLKNNKSIEFRKFGRFYIKKLKERKNARNPRTGETIHILEKKSVAFKMSKELKKRINEDRIINWKKIFLLP